MRILIRDLFKVWLGEEKAVAATEAALIFPVMLTLLLGLFDLGNAILANQKTIRASQVVADLIARKKTVTTADINSAIEAGRLAFEPMNSGSYGVDIISIGFDAMANPQISWRETQNMTPVADPFTRVAALAQADEGVLMVAVHYDFQPLFLGFVAHTVNMQEVAFSRGRGTAVVTRI